MVQRMRNGGRKGLPHALVFRLFWKRYLELESGDYGDREIGRGREETHEGTSCEDSRVLEK